MSIISLFQYDFMIRALIAGLLIGVIAPLIGIFLVVRRYSLMADTLAHISFTGIAVGLITKINPVITAIAVSVVSALGIESLRKRKNLFGESILALFLSGSLAVAIILIGLARGTGASITSFLFGSITTIQTSDLYVIAIFATLVVAITVLFYRELFFVAFDEELAKISGIPVRFVNTIFIILAAITISLSLRIVGVLLISALMVIPVLTALQFKVSFKKSLILALVFSLISIIAGLILSYIFGLASGGTIVLVTIGLFAISFLLKK